MKKKVLTAIGLMSGTSMDGIDLSIIESDGNNQLSTIFDSYFEFDQEFREKMIGLRSKIFKQQDLLKYSREINSLEIEFTLFHSKIINKVISKYKQTIDLVGFHGQTLFHDSSKKISIQLGNGNLLSKLTKKIIVNNFRQNDLKNGGQGAPLTPIYHKAISKIISENRNINFPLNIINIGGITNLTHIPNNNELVNYNFTAYDIGPGNCLIDEWLRKNSKLKFDKNGEIAKRGKLNELIINQAKENFNIGSYDISLDIKDFDLSFIRGLSLEDGCATITNFTAYLISNGIKYLNRSLQNENNFFLLCGGGRKNSFLIDSIKQYLSDDKIELLDIDNYGFNGDFIESQAFGYLAIRSFLGLAISFPETTRCKSPTVGGEINKNF